MTEKYMGNMVLFWCNWHPPYRGSSNPPIWNNDRRGAPYLERFNLDRIESNQEANLRPWPVWGLWILVKLGRERSKVGGVTQW